MASGSVGRRSSAAIEVMSNSGAGLLAESRQERLVRWRFDGMIAATALVTRMTLIHNNAADFESIRGAIERSPERFPELGPLELIRCDSLV
jgi:predicted nucleic acid-binding protein